MVILINTRFLLDDYREGYGNFVYEVSRRLAHQNSQHQFIFLFDREPVNNFDFPANVKMVVKGPPARHPLLWYAWYNFSLPSIARKYKVDVILSPDGFCSLRSRIPQVMVMHDLAFLHYPKHLVKSHLHFYRYFTGKFLKKAKKICVVSEFTKKDILENYSPDPAKISVVYSGISSDFKPIGEEEKLKILEEFSDEKEFFLATGAIHPRKNLLNLLKAFSIFKRRQKSGMKLVIAGRFAWKTDDLKEKLKTYKYRDDVVLTGYLTREVLSRLTASAYALVYPSLFEGFGLPPLEAMRSGVPALVSDIPALREISGPAALSFDPKDPEDMAAKMMMIYKDEVLRSELVAKGIEHCGQYTWDKTAELVWQSLLEASGN